MSILRRGIYSLTQGILITIVILFLGKVVLENENSLIKALAWGISWTIGSFISGIIENRYYNKNQRRKIRFVLIWAVLIISIFILMVLMNAPNAKEYIIMMQVAFSIPILVDEFQT